MYRQVVAVVITFPNGVATHCHNLTIDSKRTAGGVVVTIGSMGDVIGVYELLRDWKCALE